MSRPNGPQTRAAADRAHRRRSRLTGIATLLLALTAGRSMPARAADPPPFADPLLDAKARDIKPQDVINWQALEAVEAENGDVTVRGRLEAKEGWKIYASNLSIETPPGFKLKSFKASNTHKFMDPISAKEIDVHAGGDFEAVVTGAPRWTGGGFPLGFRYVGCTQVICLFPYTQKVEAPFLAWKAPSVPGETPGAGAQTTPATPPAAGPASAAAAAEEDLEATLARRLSSGALSYQMLLALVFVGGLLSNLTPCVYPMIPITLRVLARQGHSPYLSASMYAGGIVVTYSMLGLATALSGSLFGSLMANKSVNVGFAVVMALLGLTMLGFGDLSRLQMLGNRLGAGKPSLRNTFLMGAGAGLVAAPCTGPILAALLAYTAKSNAGVGAATGLLFSYSLGFGLPYVALGGAAARIGKVKVGHQTQIAVKLLFAAVMFGLAFYYLRIPLYGVAQGLKSHWPAVAGVTLTVGILAAAVCVILPRLHSSKLALLVPAQVLGIGIFAGSQWLSGGAANGSVTDNLVWLKDEAEALRQAAAAGKPVLIDMWAEWCEACKKMDATTFADPAVRAALARGWITLKLDLTEDNDLNTAIQTRYGLQGLPTLVMLPPEGDLARKQALGGYVQAAALLAAMDGFRGRAAE